MTVLDLGGWGALYTVGWDRRVFSTGHEAKVIKEMINQKIDEWARLQPASEEADGVLLDGNGDIVRER